MSVQALWNPAWEPHMSGSGNLTWVKAERLDMFEKTLWNPNNEPDKAGWDLDAEELRLGRTCPTRVTGTHPGT
jgi:hypothetical protein